MNKKKEIAIIGAGPAGLSMGLFLNELGYSPRIFDRKEKIDKHSKALGVNPRNLELMKTLGIKPSLFSNHNQIKSYNQNYPIK